MKGHGKIKRKLALCLFKLAPRIFKLVLAVFKLALRLLNSHCVFFTLKSEVQKSVLEVLILAHKG